MCIIGLAMKVHPDYPFILAANRDEVFSRPTKEAHFWEETPFVVGGKDVEKGGTWLGLSDQGKLAALTNVRGKGSRESSYNSRGNIVAAYLNDQSSFEQMMKNKAKFSSFNLLYGDINELIYETTQNNDQKKVDKGVHVLSNASLDSPWPKAKQLEKYMADVRKYKEKDLIDYLFSSLANSKTYPNNLLPDTGIDKELERKLSSIFIQTDNYGTMSSTVIIVDRTSKATFIEKSFNNKSTEVGFHFPISKF